MIVGAYRLRTAPELFRKRGIAYDLAKQTKSELFRDLLPLLNSGRIVLPRNERLLEQIPADVGHRRYPAWRK